MQCGKFGRHPVRSAPRVPCAALRGDGILILVAEASVEVRSRTMYLGDPDVSVPVSDRPGAGRGSKIDAGQAERRRDQRSSLLAVGAKGLSILIEECVVSPRPPTGENLLHGCDIDAEQVGERLQVRRQRHDRADIEVAVGPTVKPLADAGRERVIDRRVTERALDAHRLDAAVGIGESRDADHRVQFQERDGGCGIVEIDLARRDLLFSAAGNASESTFNPTESAVFGETPGPTPPFFSPAMALCN